MPETSSQPKNCPLCGKQETPEHAPFCSRDSKDRDGPVLRFNAHEWEAFLAGVRNGEFEQPKVQ